MNWQTITKYLMIGTVVVLAVYDIFAISYGGVDASISRELYVDACAYPIIPFALGALCGHLFWEN